MMFAIACAVRRDRRLDHRCAASDPKFKHALTVWFEDLALTSTRSADNTGVRAQVLRRQSDGSWLRIMDRPEVPQP